MKGRQRKKLLRVLDGVLEWAQTLVMSVFVVIFCFTFLFRIATVHGTSMEDTLFEEDKLIVTHLFYEPKQGDIVVAQSDALEELIIKRVIACEGQTVVIDYENSSLTVDGSVLQEDYIKNKMIHTGNVSEEFRVSDEVYEYHVPEGELFVLGDNRNVSADSREFGFLKKDCVIGKAIYRFYSLRGRSGKVS